MVTIGVSWLTKLWIASVRLTLGTRSTIRSSTFSIFAIALAPQGFAGRGVEQMRLRQVKAELDRLARSQRLGVEHARYPVAAVELGEYQRLVAERLGHGDRQRDLMHVGRFAGMDAMAG